MGWVFQPEPRWTFNQVVEGRAGTRAARELRELLVGSLVPGTVPSVWGVSPLQTLTLEMNDMATTSYSPDTTDGTAKADPLNPEQPPLA